MASTIEGPGISTTILWGAHRIFCPAFPMAPLWTQSLLRQPLSSAQIRPERLTSFISPQEERTLISPSLRRSA